jgi:hypothetical protein
LEETELAIGIATETEEEGLEGGATFKAARLSNLWGFGAADEEGSAEAEVSCLC